VKGKFLVLAFFMILVISIIPTGFVSTNFSETPLGKLAIVIVIDGADYRVLEEVNTPNLDYLASIGAFTNSALTTLPSATTVAHASLACGAFPNVTRVAHTYVVNASEYHEEPLGTEATTYGYLEVLNATTITEVAKENGVKVAVIVGKSKLNVMLGKSQAADIFETLPGTYTYSEGKNVYSSDFPMSLRYEQDEWIANRTISVIEMYSESIYKGQKMLILVNMPSVDWTGHTYGRNSTQYKSILENADAQVGRIVDKIEELGLWSNTLLFVLPDHGQEVVDPDKRVLPTDPHHWGVLTGIDHYLIDAGGVAAHIYLRDPENDLQKAINYLWGSGKVYAIYSRYSAENINGTLEDIGLNTEYAGDLFVELKPGYQFYYENLGAHGASYTQRIFMCVAGWTVKQGYEISGTPSIVDIAPTISAFLGIPSPPQAQGTPMVSLFSSPFGSVSVSVNPQIANVGTKISINATYSLSEIQQGMNLKIIIEDENDTEVYENITEVSSEQGKITIEWTTNIPGNYRVIAILVDSEGVVIDAARSSVLIVKVEEAKLPWARIYAAGVITVVLGVIAILLSFKFKEKTEVKG